MIRPRKSLFITFQTLRQHLRGASDQHSRRDGAAGPKEEQKDQHRSRHPRRMAASERPQTRTGCPKPDRGPCAKHTDRTEFRWCIELVKEPCQQMSSGNREAPVFPLHAGFAILPCLIAKTVINTLQAESNAAAEPHCEEGEEIMSNLHTCARTKSVRESDRYEHWIGSPAPLGGALPARTNISGCTTQENPKAARLPQTFFCFLITGFQ